MSEKVEKVLSRLGNIWPKRLDDDGVVDFLSDWESALKNFEGWVIDAAATRLIQSRTKTGFPVPREMIDACNEVLANERRSKPQLAIRPEQQHGDPFELADALIDCQLGREAARAEPCWLLALHDFCRANRRLPASSEIHALKRTAEEFEKNYRLCVTGEAGDFSKGLEALGATMMRRRENLRARLLGREAA